MNLHVVSDFQISIKSRAIQNLLSENFGIYENKIYIMYTIGRNNQEKSNPARKLNKAELYKKNIARHIPRQRQDRVSSPSGVESTVVRVETRYA